MSASGCGQAVVTALDRRTTRPAVWLVLPRRDDGPGALPGGRSLQPASAARPGCRRWPTGRSAGAAGPRCATAAPGRRAGASPGLPRRTRAPRPRRRPAGRANSRRWSTFGADEHRLQRLGRGEQQVRRVGEDGLAAGGGGVAVPERDPAARPAAVDLQARQQVVEQRLERAQVERRTGRSSPRRPSGSGPGRRPPRSCRRRSARAAARRRRAAPARCASRCSGRSVVQPRVFDQVVRQRRVQAADVGRPRLASVTGRVPRRRRCAGGHAAALRSVSVSSVAERVSL